jgi:hypothetical protein
MVPPSQYGIAVQSEEDWRRDLTKAENRLALGATEGDSHPSPTPVTADPIATLSFIGLGVRGEPMRGRLARNPILAHDSVPSFAAVGV